MRKLNLIIFSLMLMIIVLPCFGKVIASVTLHVTLTVSPNPVTSYTEEGDYGDYYIQHEENAVFVIVK